MKYHNTEIESAITGTIKYRRKLSKETIEYIRILRQGGILLRHIAKIFSIHESTVSRICSFQRHRHV